MEIVGYHKIEAGDHRMLKAGGFTALLGDHLVVGGCSVVVDKARDSG